MRSPPPVRGLRRISASRIWRPDRPAADPAGSRTAPCASGSPCFRGESPSDDTLETKGFPRVRQRFVRLDRQDLTLNNAPVCAKIETVAHVSFESFFISHSSISGPCVSARQTFSRGCGISLSTISVLVSLVCVIDPSSSIDLLNGQIGYARRSNKS
jgi:hypothetical protein